jgi:hypothetical protein
VRVRSHNFRYDPPKIDPADLKVLIVRRDRALARMAVISEANASRAFTPDRGGRPHSGSAPPPGVNLERVRSQAECPDKDASLYHFYVWQFARAKPEDLATLCFLAERDTDERLGAGVTQTNLSRARSRSILSSKYRGQPAEVVAAVERCSVMHVRRHRKANGMNPNTGVMER